MDVELLSRIQFAFTISFHYLYPPLSIGLGVLLVIIEAAWLRTRDPMYHQMARYWTRIFALTFSMGVATGIVMEFEFGTNWATYSRYVGDVFGSALAAEGIFAFFLESGFLAVLLFGWDKVSPRWHFFSTCMVCFGAHFSAIWIVVANSWQQTPAGFHVVEHLGQARAEITDFWAMVFNPSSMDRLSHVLCGAWQAGAFLAISVSAWYLLRGRHEAFARASLRIALWMALAASALQVVTGHSSAVGVARNQPAKLAAFEGHYDTGAHAPIYLFGWVDERRERVVGGPRVLGGLSWLAHGRADAEVTGLRAFPREDRPPVALPFQAFHAMVGLGFVLLALSASAVALMHRDLLFQSRPMLWAMVFAVLGPQIANQAGWWAAEVGRQPWIVQGLLRTSEGLSRTVRAEAVLASLVLFTAVYALLFAVFVYLLNDKIQKGPHAGDLVPTGKLALPERGNA
ncbi:MAG TPA: cytochrome ubiquinol oxidase subunit I [Verrucomicrobiae bacterium]|nr:cytochrome ubiquinol oxidase subunit I [Verrucomicrobiae bacterium]